MTKDIKILFAAIGFVLLIVVGLAFWQGSKKEGGIEGVATPIEGVVANPESYELGNVPINGGIVTKEYSIKNTTANTIKLKKVTTSCMCTKASVTIGEKSTKFFGMEAHGDKNPPINLEMAPGQEAKVTTQFDPAAHGPQGVGFIDRSVFLTFSDPAGVKELKFNGTVVSN